jgi:hypothetical protein
MTAVDFLKNNLPSLFVDDSGHYAKLFEHAKQMEKEQMELSDEQIEEEVKTRLPFESTQYADGFMDGANWYKDQINK